jgi:hypothetical protein
VLDTPNGPVTLLLVPNREVSRTASKQDQGLIAVARAAFSPSPAGREPG